MTPHRAMPSFKKKATMMAVGSAALHEALALCVTRHHDQHVGVIRMWPSQTSSLQSSPPHAAPRRRKISLLIGFDADTEDFYHEQSASNVNDNSASIETATEQLQPHFPFPLDRWQLSAGASILSGHNVIVCAPTGAGKTVVGEMALRVALDKRTKAIYTTPLKALSNQKFAEMRKVFGINRVGLATGDISIQRGADVTIMTTEVYRNMAWRARTGAAMGTASDNPSLAKLADKLETARYATRDEQYADLTSNSIVVLDEFHYMGEKGRGSTWEESVIFNPPSTQIVGLSATLPNAHRIAAWMQSVTGRKSLLIQADGKRPVPLRYYFASRYDFEPLFRDEEAGPGAPHGLLGLRGDGILFMSPKHIKKHNKAFGNTDALLQMQGLNERGLPKGLDLNPVLQTAAERRLASIDRKIQRIVQQQSYDENDGYYGQGSTMSVREQRKMKENMLKAELRKSVPSIDTLLQRLQRNNLLPAIFFIFSRKGCDNAAQILCENLKSKAQEKENNNKPVREEIKKIKKLKGKGRGRGRRQSNNDDWDLNHDELAMIQDEDGRNFRADLLDQLLSDEFDAAFGKESAGEAEDDSFLSERNLRYFAEVGLLSYVETKEVASRVLTFNAGNPEIAFDDVIVDQLLCGIGSHHAGILPAHKAFVETLFRLELMKVVFATETLAAGINMPARTTVICAMAKRGDLGMELLETSNMLQMAGRAGRRGMDTEGACVVASTPFEGPEDAITILTNEVKPIVSQFTPSYALAVNLVDRGAGKLDLARSMVEKSFGVWESKQRELDLKEAMKSFDSGDDNAEEKFLNALQLALEKELLEARDGTSPTGTSQSKIAKLTSLVDILSDGKKLKKVSKRYSGAASILDLEMSTLAYLEREYQALDEENSDPDLPFELVDADRKDLMAEIQTQRQRVMKGEREVNNSLLSVLSKVANNRMKDETNGSLRKALAATRLSNEEYPTAFIEGAPLEPGELNAYIKKAPKSNRRPLLDQTTAAPSDDSEDESWRQMQALIKVLRAYGCLIQSEPRSDENIHYTVTPGGEHVGSLSVDNSLWLLSALGGAWDVAYESSELDKFQDAFADFDNEIGDEREVRYKSTIPKPQAEAETLTKYLCDLASSEMAGYVSSLVVDTPRRADSALESFQKLTHKQQRVVQGALLSLERLVEVQRRSGLDDAIGKCQLELSSCDVVTAWASGASWNDVLAMSGAAPGDLVRTLSRALDALRQIANLPYIPARGLDGTVRLEASGIHPKIRSLCREAANEMDRYPVKDDLPFQENEDDTDRDERTVQEQEVDA
ncbi:hypothetical protein ACHAWX_003980 [Stephanocyclus meneghinianus]